MLKIVQDDIIFTSVGQEGDPGISIIAPGPALSHRNNNKGTIEYIKRS